MARAQVAGGIGEHSADAPGRDDATRRTRIVRSIVLTTAGFVLGAGVQETLRSVERAMADETEMWAGLGAVLTAMYVGVPAGIAFTLATFGLARVPWWPVAATVALGFGVASASVATPLLASSPTDDPGVWPWFCALAFGLTTAAFDHVRGRAALVLVPVVVALIAALAVLREVGVEHRAEQQRAERAAGIAATDLPVLTTEVDGHVPVFATSRPVDQDAVGGPEISVTFVSRTAGDAPSLDEPVYLRTFRANPRFTPPTNCPATSVATDTDHGLCTEVAPGIWWSDRHEAAIRVDGDVLVVVDRGLSDLPKDALIEAAGRAHPTTVETLAGYTR